MDEGINHFQRDYFGQTTLHPVGLLVLAACCIASMLVARKHVIWTMMIVACFISPAQRVVIASVDFGFLRIISMCVLLRLMLRAEVGDFRWIRLDSIMLIWAVGHVVIPVLRTGTAELVSKIGFSGDALLMYFALRLLLRSLQDLRSLILAIAAISVPTAISFLIERQTGRNLFAFLGGVPEVTMIRDGRMRCQGAFSHPLIAGCFWGALLPIVVAEFWQKNRRTIVAVLGIACAMIIILATASSTPLSAVLIGIIGGCAFYVRRHMRVIRWSLLGLAFLLHMVMAAPVWHLIARINIVGGSSSYHRFQLIDGAIRHYHEWWLIGSRVGTDHWGWMTFDVCNYYVVQGLHGGILLLGVFVWMMAESFRCCGAAVRRFETDRSISVMAWALGVCMLMHVTNFIGVSYFGQLPLVLFLNLAAAACIFEVRSSAVVPRPVRQMPQTRMIPNGALVAR